MGRLFHHLGLSPPHLRDNSSLPLAMNTQTNFVLMCLHLQLCFMKRLIMFCTLLQTTRVFVDKFIKKRFRVVLLFLISCINVIVATNYSINLCFWWSVSFSYEILLLSDFLIKILLFIDQRLRWVSHSCTMSNFNKLSNFI